MSAPVKLLLFQLLNWTPIMTSHEHMIHKIMEIIQIQVIDTYMYFLSQHLIGKFSTKLWQNEKERFYKMIT